MNSTSSSSMALVLADYHKKSANLRSNMLKNEGERIQLEEKLRSLSTVDSRLKQQQQIEHVQAYFTKLNQESQRAEVRNSQLLNDLTKAEHNLNQLRIDVEHLIRLKHDYVQYLESNHPNLPKPGSAGTNTNNYNSDRSHQQSNVSPTKTSPAKKNTNRQQDDHSSSDSTSNTFSRSKRAGSLRMELNRPGLFFLLDYIEKELIDTIDKKKFYRHDPPTITQKRTILDIANDQQQFAVKDLDPATASMVILDQLPSTIRRTTINKCLLTEDILSSNIKDLDKDSITKMLPEQDRSLWTRLVDHFTRLLKYHIMSSQTLANKFAPTLLPNNMLYLHDKAKGLLQHIVEKLVGTQSLSSDDETTTNKKHSIQNLVKINPTAPSSWLNKSASRGGIDDDLSSSSSSSSTPKKNTKSISSIVTTPRANTKQDDSDLEFYS